MVSRLFQVEGRHQGTSLIFIGQNIFDGDDIKEIRRQSDYLVLFRCVSGRTFLYFEKKKQFFILDCLSISTLSRYMTGGSTLFNIYLDATIEPFSYLFVNQTQNAEREQKYLTNLFDSNNPITSYIVRQK